MGKMYASLILFNSFNLYVVYVCTLIKWHYKTVIFACLLNIGFLKYWRIYSRHAKQCKLARSLGSCAKNLGLKGKLPHIFFDFLGLFAQFFLLIYISAVGYIYIYMIFFFERGVTSGFLDEI